MRTLQLHPLRDEEGREGTVVYRDEGYPPDPVFRLGEVHPVAFAELREGEYVNLPDEDRGWPVLIDLHGRKFIHVT